MKTAADHVSGSGGVEQSIRSWKFIIGSVSYDKLVSGSWYSVELTVTEQ